MFEIRVSLNNQNNRTGKGSKKYMEKSSTRLQKQRTKGKQREQKLVKVVKSLEQVLSKEAIDHLVIIFFCTLLSLPPLFRVLLSRLSSLFILSFHLSTFFSLFTQTLSCFLQLRYYAMKYQVVSEEKKKEETTTNYFRNKNYLTQKVIFLF